MFQSQPVSIARALVLLATLTLNLTAALGQNDAGKIYRCAAKDAVSLQDNGALRVRPGTSSRITKFSEHEAD